MSSQPPGPEPEPPPAEPVPEPPFRRCSRCTHLLPASAFNRNGADRQWWCRECFRSYFRERGAKHVEQVSAAKRLRQRDATAFVRAYLAEHPCTDCGLAEVVVLEFDHVGIKRDNVSQLRHSGMGRERLAEEIAQCEVVCANCHRRRTARRASWIRRDDRWRARLRRCRPEMARNLEFVYRTLEDFPCIDCGEEDICVLEFDHIGPKRAPVMWLAMHGYRLRTVANEVAQCEIRCANCHRRRHSRGAQSTAAAA